MENRQTVTLGIDQSYTSTAVFALRAGEMVSHKVFGTVAEDGGKTPVHYMWRAQKIAEQIVEVAKEVQPIRIGLEGLGFGSAGDQTRNLAGLQFVIMDYLDRAIREGELHEDTYIDIITPSALKKFATGKGRASKDMMVDAVADFEPRLHAHLMTIPKSKGRYDITDAYFLSKFSADQLYGTFTLDEKQAMFLEGVW